MPGQQVLVCANEERSGAAGRIDNAQFGGLLRRLLLQQFADGVLDDVIDDVRGRVINAARFFDLGFVFDLRLMAFGEADDFAEELFVNLAENVGWQNRKSPIRAGFTS